MEFTFKDLKLTEYEKFWLNKINDFNFYVQNLYRQDFVSYLKYLKKGEIKELKKDIEKREQGFNGSKINKSLFFRHHITLIGLWHIDPQNEVFENIPKIIARVKQKINEKFQYNTNNVNININELSRNLNISENKIKYTLFLLKDFDNFIDSKEDSQDYISIDINDSNVIEAYLDFNSTDEIMENFFVNNNAVKNEPFDVLFQFIIDIIKTISKKESIYLAFIGGAIWFGLYLILNKIPFPNDLDYSSLIGVTLGLFIFLFLLFAFLSMLYYPLYNFFIDDELKSRAKKEENYLRNYFLNLGIALIPSLMLSLSLFFYLKPVLSNWLFLILFPIALFIAIFLIYPMFKNYILPKIFKKINIWKKPWWINIIYTFYTDGVFLFVILLFVSLTFDIFLNKNDIQINNIFSFKGMGYFFLYLFLYILCFSFIITVMNIILGNYINDNVIKKYKNINKEEEKELYSMLLKTVFVGISGLVLIIYVFAAFKVFSFNAFLDNTFSYVHIGSYYSKFVIKKSYFEKIKHKELRNLLTINKSLRELENKLNCKYKEKGKKKYLYCNFKRIGKSKNYYKAEFIYKKENAKKGSLIIKFNKNKFKKYQNALKIGKETKNLLKESIIPFSYCSVNGNPNSVLCQFYVLLNLGSNYAIRIRNYNYMDNYSKKTSKYSILTIPKKYVLGTKLNN